MKDMEIRYKSGKEKGKIITKYEWIIKELLRKGKHNKTFRVHLKYWTGGAGKSRLVDNEHNYITVLRTYGIKFTQGNDAPRGGVAGDYIEIKRN